LSAAFLETTAGGSVAKRSAAYGMAAEEVDGNDFEAVFTAVTLAAGRARMGLGPALVECQSYRWEGHSILYPARNPTARGN
jgi:pyruvate dehydrogenase E1 component alpha subunit